MKKATKILSLAFAATMAASAFAGCVREPIVPDKELDTSKSQLKVSNYEGGYGRAWLDNAALRFEEMYKDYEFEPGKKGVQVQISSAKDGKAGEGFLSGVKSTDFHVIVTEDAFYYDIVSQNLAADITDAVTGKLSEFGEEVSIESKMDSALQSFFKTGQGKYYALPHYESFYGIMYDKDVFNEKGLWLSESGTYVKPNAEGKFTVTLAKGPDGLANTYDDGLPATFDEFFALCNYMVKEKGVTPFTCSGQYISMLTAAMYQMWADYEGKENFQKYVSLEGPVSVIDSLSGDGTMSAQGTYANMKTVETLTKDNAWEMKNQAGKAVALEFMKRMVSDSSYYHADMFSNAVDNIRAQANYLLGALENKPVAFLIDGVWWENEAEDAGTYALYEAEYGESASRKSRNFGLLPFPKATSAQVGENRTLAMNLSSLVFLNAGATQDENALKMAKKFMQFLHTDNELQEFSVTTSALKPFKYSVSAEKVVNMSTFGKDIVAMRSNNKIETVYMVSDNQLYLNNVDYYHPAEAFRTSEGQNPIELFKKDKSLTVKQMFDKMTTYNKNYWK